jgi:hypothetical protein
MEWRPTWRSGGNTRLLHYARGRGFDSRTVQTFVCMNMFVMGLGVSMYNMYLQKNKYVFIRYLEPITQAL